MSDSAVKRFVMVARLERGRAIEGYGRKLGKFRGKWVAKNMTGISRWIATVAVLAGIAGTLVACQEQRDAFNPIRLACPGDFDPASNTCRIHIPTR